jgi:hypothetical protein
VDLDHLLVFPPCTGVVTTVRPDVVIYSVSRKIVIWIELTVPVERRFLESAVKKTMRYKHLEIALAGNGWTVHPFTAEVGCIGFLSQTARRSLKALGFRGSQLKHTLSRMSQAARRSSFYIWNARRERDWFAPTLYQQRFVREGSVSTSGAHHCSPQNTESALKKKPKVSAGEKNDEEAQCFFSDEGKHDTLSEEDNHGITGGDVSLEMPLASLLHNPPIVNLPSSPSYLNQSNRLLEDDFLAEEELMADGMLDADDNSFNNHLHSLCDKFL